MGKYDKYKKTTESTNLDKYKKKSGQSFDDIDKKLDSKPAEAVKENKASAGGNILIAVLGIATVVVWVLALGKLF